MLTRRHFIVSTTAAACIQSGASLTAAASPNSGKYASRRPALAKRRFVSSAVEQTIKTISAEIGDPKLAWLFTNCYPNPLDTTVEIGNRHGQPDTFVLTGDIPAMWQRDTMDQMWPYLPLVKQDARLQSMIKGVINRMVHNVRLAPYANAYLKNAAQHSPWEDDLTHMSPGVWEHKWEVDSLCSVIRLSHGYWQTSGDTSPFDANWTAAMDRIIQTFRAQQHFDGLGPYYFQRPAPARRTPVPKSAYGPPGKACGMIFTRFRPSDDAVTYPLHIPDNLFAALSLQQLAHMHEKIHGDQTRAASCRSLAKEIQTAINKYGIVNHPQFGRIYAYEVDGMGNKLMMDDANPPSLLALPFMGVCAPHDPLYKATRAFCWSRANPWFCKGKFSGIGSPHTGTNTVWPLSLILYGLTASNATETAWAIGELKNSSAGTGFMHESFHKNNPAQFTRPWFAMANAMFGELVIQTYRRYPHILRA